MVQVRLVLGKTFHLATRQMGLPWVFRDDGRGFHCVDPNSKRAVFGWILAARAFLNSDLYGYKANYIPDMGFTYELDGPWPGIRRSRDLRLVKDKLPLSEPRPELSKSAQRASSRVPKKLP